VYTHATSQDNEYLDEAADRYDVLARTANASADITPIRTAQA